MGKLRIVPITIRAAKKMVAELHRHHRTPLGGLFAVAVAKEGEEEPFGCAIIGRPVSRHLQDGLTAEVTRCVTDGTRNACSKLYGAAWKAARALGYTRLITYTLEEEGGASLRASNFKLIGTTRGRSWSRPKREREDNHPLQDKLRWELNEE